ncbi:uncharacterized protein LOC135840298 isoform X2 [Planococcus citri]|uniref:uncharacterized protein LOC135840298 isoform X2 n=1 Tax=Planococcus citri TaxID=170843 RepID=UPI0031F90C06
MLDENTTNKMEDELDVLLVLCGESEISLKWGSYLISRFQTISKNRNIPSFKLRSLKLEEILESLLENGTIDKYPEARVQIVVVCPMFVEKIQSIPETETSLGKLFQQEKVVALMLGLDVQQQWDSNHIRTVIPKCELWRKMTVKSEYRISADDFLGIAMDILSKSRQIQEALNLEQQQPHFSVMPKKIKVGQNTILVLLNEPIANKDDIKVTIDKNGRHLDVGTVKRRNPYTLQFAVPACCFQVSMLVYVCVEKNGKNLGKRQVKCESKMRELDQMIQTLENPIHFMCQSFNLNTNDKDQLDTFLCDAFQKNIPPHFDLLKSSIPIDKTTTSNEEFPTLLHFTAKYGLEKLSWLLIESPGGEQACQIRNCLQLTPSEIAEQANHTNLSKTLNNFSRLAELSNTCNYKYLKEMRAGKKRDTSESNYVLPKPVDDTYLIPPEPRPIDDTYLIPPVPRPVVPSLPPPDIDFHNSSPSSEHCYMNFKECSFPFLLNTPLSPTFADSPTLFQNYEVPPTARPCTPYTPNLPTSPIGEQFEGYLDMNSIGIPRPVVPPLPPTDTDFLNSSPSSEHCYMNFKESNFPFALNTPLSPAFVDLFQNYEVPPTARPCTPYTPNLPTSPIGEKFEGYLDMNSIEKEVSDFGSPGSFSTNNEFPDNFDDLNKLDYYETVSSPDSIATSKYDSTSHLISRGKVSPDDELLEMINYFKHDFSTINEVGLIALVEKWRNRKNDVQQSFKDRQDQLDKMKEEYDRVQHKMKEHMNRTLIEKIRRFFSRGKLKGFNSSKRASAFESDMLLNAFKISSSMVISAPSSPSIASSRTNSTISNGSRGNNKSGQGQYDQTRFPFEKLNPKTKKIPTSVSQPVEAADNSDYVQPDNVSRRHNNHLSSFSSSMINNTIHECIESDLEACSNSCHSVKNRRNTYHANGDVSKNYKSLFDQLWTNSLRRKSKNNLNNKNKVRSVESLICDWKLVKNKENRAETASNSDILSEAASKPSGSSSSQIINCAHTIQCLSGMTNDEAQIVDMPVSSSCTSLPDKEPDANESLALSDSECGSIDSHRNSSLNLSSMSLNSDCTVDENGDIKCSLEFNTTEKKEIEVENSSPVVLMNHQHVNTCASMPEYVNVTGQNSPAVPNRCAYTVLSS